MAERSPRTSKIAGKKKASRPRVASPAAPAPKTPRVRRRVDAAEKAVRTCAVEAARLLNDRHCQDVLLLDVRGKSDVMDYIVIGTGTSDRQIRAVSHEVAQLAGQHGLNRLGTEADAPANWIVVDLADIVVHLFAPPTRSHYDLEMLWGDAPRIRWRRTREAGDEKGE